MADLNETIVNGTLQETGNIKESRQYFMSRTNNTGSWSSLQTGNTVYQEFTITTHGRPVFISCDGDNNPSGDLTAWLSIKLYRDGTFLSMQTDQSDGNSCNIPFCTQYLDIVPAGTYTYKIAFVIGKGPLTLVENANQEPRMIVYEI